MPPVPQYVTNPYAAKIQVREMIRMIGEDPARPGLIETPARVVKSWQELYRGYQQDPQEVLKTFDAEGMDEMIVSEGIQFYSTCEHHLLPFYGVCHIGYVPDKSIVGLSKLSRLVDVFARPMQVQERLTCQIAKSFQEHVQPLGVGVVMRATHLCACARGVRQPGKRMVTSKLLGVFRDTPEARSEFLSLVRAK